jgi:hypothetical protein
MERPSISVRRPSGNLHPQMAETLASTRYVSAFERDAAGHVATHWQIANMHELGSQQPSLVLVHLHIICLIDELLRQVYRNGTSFCNPISIPLYFPLDHAQGLKTHKYTKSCGAFDCAHCADRMWPGSMIEAMYESVKPATLRCIYS